MTKNLCYRNPNPKKFAIQLVCICMRIDDVSVVLCLIGVDLKFLSELC